MAWLPSCSGGEPTEPAGAGTAEEVAVVAGDGASAPAGTVLPDRPTVRVLDGAGRPVSGVEVRFRVVAGDGRVEPSTVATDPSGRAATTWVLGSDPGSDQVLEAHAGERTARIDADAEAPIPGVRHEGREGYTVWLVGDLPLILSAPHGGGLRPVEIPDRGYGVTVKDLRSLELALEIRDAVEARTGGRPHVIYTRLHRTKLDANRPLEEAAQGQPAAERAWREYHAFLEAASAEVERSAGPGLLLDVHGHGHDVPRVELGYLLDDEQLELSDDALRSGGFAAETSVRDLATRSPHSFPELLRGEASLGGLLEARGVAVVPGPGDPDPGGEPYFEGGYITRRHGSVDGGRVSAVQLEHHWPGLRDTRNARAAYAADLSDALTTYFPTHFGRPLDAGAGTAPGPVSRSTAPAPPPAGAGSGG